MQKLDRALAYTAAVQVSTFRIILPIVGLTDLSQMINPKTDTTIERTGPTGTFLAKARGHYQ